MELSEGFYEWCGYLGVATYIGSYTALQTGFVRGRSFAYIMANLTAASLVLVSLINAYNQASALIQITWVCISLYGLARLYSQKRRLVFSPEEAAFVDRVLPQFSKYAAREFLNSGHWCKLDDGHVLTSLGKPAETLYFILSGRAKVHLHGQVFAHVEDGFVGEISVMNDCEATADVTADGSVHAFAITATALEKFCRSDDENREMLRLVLSQDTSRKLQASNAKLSGTEQVSHV